MRDPRYDPLFEPILRRYAWGTLAHATGHVALTRGLPACWALRRSAGNGTIAA